MHRGVFWGTLKAGGYLETLDTDWCIIWI